MGYKRNWKPSKSNMELYLKNKKIVNDYFEKIKEELNKKEIRYSEHSFSDLNSYNVSLSTTIYIDGKYRVSTHKKKNEAYDMDNGILITMRNVNKNNFEEDINKILKYIGKD